MIKLIMWQIQDKGPYLQSYLSIESPVNLFRFFKCPRIFQKISEFSIIFQNVPEGSRMLQKIPECSRIFQNALEYCRMLQNVPDDSRVFQRFKNVALCSKIA